MTGFPRRLFESSSLFGSLAPCSSLAALVLLSSPGAAQDTLQLYQDGLRAYQQGDDAAAQQAFGRVLALDPDADEAYEMWRTTDEQLMVRMLAEGGQFELLYRRIMSLSEPERSVANRDENAIREAYDRALSDDPIERRRGTLALTHNHGEFAVPLMVRSLREQTEENRRVATIMALSRMSSRVVAPLIECMTADDATVRRNVASILGRIGDSRAIPMLAWSANGDGNASVRASAAEALNKLGGGGAASELFAAQGDAYYRGDMSVNAPTMRSDVVWSWSGGGLESTDVPSGLYGMEMAKKAYYRSLGGDPNNAAALAGLARVYAGSVALLEHHAARGNDVGGLLEQAHQGVLALELAGSESLTAALSTALAEDDAMGAIGLCRVLGGVASGPSPALGNALNGAGAVRWEAALALAEIALRNGYAPNTAVIDALGQAAGRDIAHTAVVIGQGDRGPLASALRASGVATTAWSRGLAGVAGLHRLPGVDVVLVSATLSDVTTDAVVDDVGRNAATAGTPVVVFSDDTDAAEAVWDGVAAAIVPADGSDIDSITGTMNDMTGDRAEADALAARCASMLGDLARANSGDMSGARAALLAAAGRHDGVALPALSALAAAGTAGEVGGLLALIGDGGRSDESREAAGNALGEILGRTGGADGAYEALAAVVGDDGNGLGVRRSAARAMARMTLDPGVRSGLLNALRVNLGE